MVVAGDAPKFNRLLTLSDDVGRFNWSRSCWAAALAAVSVLLERIEDKDVLPVVGLLPLELLVTPGIFVPLPDVNRFARLDEPGFL